MKYEMTKEDKQRIESDLQHNTVIRFLRQQENNKFNIGDILVKETRVHEYKIPVEDQKWAVHKTPIGAPVKYMYVHENEYSVGYVKQLRADGTGFTSSTTCLANIDLDSTRFVLDPEYADHLMLNPDEKFEYNNIHASRKQFREEAMAKNRKQCVSIGSAKKAEDFLKTLKIGDELWMGGSFEDLITCKFRVNKIGSEACYSGFGEPVKGQRTVITLEVIEHRYKTPGTMFTINADSIQRSRVSLHQPFKLTND